MTVLDQSLSEHFARVALGHVTRPFPTLPALVLRSANDLHLPQDIHPIFFGSLDWHSCVHGYWLLTRLLRLFPDFSARNSIEDLFAKQFTAANVMAETEYFSIPLHHGFERPYGWGWVLQLSAELQNHPVLGGYHQTFSPLAARIAELYRNFLPVASYPVRVGTHYNSAFSMSLSLDYAEKESDSVLHRLIRQKALEWFSNDAACQAWEPCGDEFLSPSLVEAALMARILGSEQFTAWFDTFLPDLDKGLPATLFTPAEVTDRADGKIAHLDGLNLSRVWCWRQILAKLPESWPARSRVHKACDIHLHASLPHVTGDYMGEHWLATYAVMALQD
ncbi:DUF2891 domain-containing protein [Gluconacetobacter entanii]|uniref:DUF2891 domain-containing protein n=1 Tax=Gluconacetobacter entanii TaxID=108528 RepID=UPI00187B9DD2|nr:DUF2891 domain-containing protein [Gluconacetobacter entanii]MBE7620898.1 DUF2891 family protein [Komagataeibacter sp. FXV2]MBY4638809.1 DUF2891 domain-containing protein [Gluconacetobacter entanii]MCW4580735.1 DUF2891 domain-containing protein [Gluconacetobacter entanii]MCW4584064.1 DUF2891 domain-containing protein [Gluconacetobacter entanii]MCW4587472.1 DUF2891 domain-containing protein [Gluconacetobacter entanii]